MIHIRPTTPTDLPAVLPMVASLCAPHEAWDGVKYSFRPNPAQGLHWLTEQATNARSIFLVVEHTSSEPSESGALFAFLVGTIEIEIPLYRLKEFGFIRDLWIEPNDRKLGLGRQLTEYALQTFSQKGIQQARLDTAIANEATRQ